MGMLQTFMQQQGYPMNSTPQNWTLPAQDSTTQQNTTGQGCNNNAQCGTSSTSNSSTATSSTNTTDDTSTTGSSDTTTSTTNTAAAATTDSSTTSSQDTSADWAGNSFHYQCVNVSEDVEALSKSDVDTMFLETRYLKDGQLGQLQTKPDGTHRNILAYQSMSETANWTGEEWDAANSAGIVRGSNPSWPDCKYVDVTSPEWKKLMVQRATDAAKSGVDGMFLDTMDGWDKVGGDSEKNKAAMKDIVVAMASAARAINPNFKIVGNNDSDLAAGDASYAATVNGHMREGTSTISDSDKTEKVNGKPIFVETYNGNSSISVDADGYLHENQADASLSLLPAI